MMGKDKRSLRGMGSPREKEGTVSLVTLVLLPFPTLELFFQPTMLRYAWRDKKNEEISDALVAFLFDLPKTGKGTMTTLNKFKTGQYKFVLIQKNPTSPTSTIRGNKPSLVLWDLKEENKDTLAQALRDFVNLYKPASLMVAGSTASVAPDLDGLGADVFRLCWGVQ
jgi:hypothetical protein